ncbi:hypothetical protein D5R95_00225 [Methanosalsum natronophilum]|uniref:Uncharacterized protein n=1 Tax=Methanosalsum natronophilum TaxID=768733 RepID=A0A424Z4K7_9EURY|nr:MAG: hypothetical protein D5R95_00225 [Methanosalsum natronophilum]
MPEEYEEEVAGAHRVEVEAGRSEVMCEDGVGGSSEHFSTATVMLVKRTEIQVLYPLLIDEDFIIELEPFCHIDREEKLLCVREELPVIVMKV